MRADRRDRPLLVAVCTDAPDRRPLRGHLHRPPGPGPAARGAAADHGQERRVGHGPRRHGRLQAAELTDYRPTGAGWNIRLSFSNAARWLGTVVVAGGYSSPGSLSRDSAMRSSIVAISRARAGSMSPVASGSSIARRKSPSLLAGNAWLSGRLLIGLSRCREAPAVLGWLPRSRA